MHAAAQRPRAKLPGGSGQFPMIVARTSGPGAPPYGPARRVSFSELLGGRLLGLGRRGMLRFMPFSHD